MNMVEKEKDLVNFAHRVLTFRMNIIEDCQSKGIAIPTDEQISEYINSYGFHFDDFMADYTEHEGMFRCTTTPLEEFKNKVKCMEFVTAPTDEEIVKFFNQHGDNVSLFYVYHRMMIMPQPLVRETCLNTIEKLSAKNLALLWDAFIEESGIYGADSHIYCFEKDSHFMFLSRNMTAEELQYVNKLAKNGARFIQWFNLNDNSIKELTEDDIKVIIMAHWDEIFDRIMLYPSSYSFNAEIFKEGDGSDYFGDVFFPIIAKEVGYLIDVENGTIEYVEKKC